MSRIEFQHGPVTITVDGLPDCVLPESVHMHLGIFSVYHPEGERVAAFAEDFAALGGIETFPEITPQERFSAKDTTEGRVDGRRACHLSTLQLYPPTAGDPSGTAVLASADAIVTALDVDRHARDVRSELEQGERLADFDLIENGDIGSVSVREATEEASRRIATLVDLKIADIRAVDADAYPGFVADAAIRSVAHKTAEDWETVLRAWRGSSSPARDEAWRWPANALWLSDAGAAAARPMVAIMGRSVFDLDPCERLRS